MLYSLEHQTYSSFSCEIMGDLCQIEFEPGLSVESKTVGIIMMKHFAKGIEEAGGIEHSSDWDPYWAIYIEGSDEPIMPESWQLDMEFQDENGKSIPDDVLTFTFSEQFREQHGGPPVYIKFGHDPYYDNEDEEDEEEKDKIIRISMIRKMELCR